MIFAAVSGVLRVLVAAVIGIGGAHTPTSTQHQASPAVHAQVAAVSRPAAPVATPCETALAYLRVHGNPAFEMKCEPGTLPAGIAAFTCWKATALGVSCPDGGMVIISDPSCPISYENEASNSWLNFATLTGGALNGRGRHDASGRTVDPFGECG